MSRNFRASSRCGDFFITITALTDLGVDRGHPHKGSQSASYALKSARVSEMRLDLCIARLDELRSLRYVFRNHELPA